LQGTDVGDAIVDEATVYNQWTVFPKGYDPIDAGLRFEPSPVGDLDGGGSLDVADVDALIEKIRGIHRSKSFSAAEMFDVNIDGRIDEEDLDVWVKDLKKTWFGDANLDGSFDTSDLVTVFQAGEYEDGRLQNSSWATGDWNGDAEFDTADLVRAFQDGGFERGSRSATSAVPEPSSPLMAVAVACVIVARSMRRRRCAYTASARV
jgi:hypothetical protein